MGWRDQGFKCYLGCPFWNLKSGHSEHFYEELLDRNNQLSLFWKTDWRIGFLLPSWYFSIQNASPRCDEKGLRSGGCAMTILSSDYRRIIVGSCSNRLYIGGSNSESFRSNLELKISWQAQYLVDLECHFSWQAQHVVKFWEIAGARNVVFFHTKCVSHMGKVSEAAGARWRFYLRIMFGQPRIMVESSLYWRKQFRELPLKSI